VPGSPIVGQASASIAAETCTDHASERGEIDEREQLAFAPRLVEATADSSGAWRCKKNGGGREGSYCRHAKQGDDPAAAPFTSLKRREVSDASQ